MPTFNILLNPLSLKPPAKKVYITHHKVITIENLVHIYVRLSIITHKQASLSSENQQ